MIFNRKEYEIACGISKANYTTYRTRGKIFEQIDENGNVFIDTSHPVNSAFYEMRCDVMREKQREQLIQEVLQPPKPDPIPTVIQPTVAENPLPKAEQKKLDKQKEQKIERFRKGQEKAGIPTQQNDQQAGAVGTKFALELQKLQAEIKQKEVDIQLKEQKLATIIGNNIPSPIVMEMFAQLAKSLLTGYKAFAEQTINDFCHKHKIQEKERVTIIGKMVTGLNTSHTKAVNDARAQMKAELKRHKIKDSLEDEENDA